MKEIAPAFQFYPRDYLADENVAALTAAEEGLYWRAICYCWLEGSIPKDPDRLAKVLGKECTLEQATNVQRLFNGRSTNPQRLTHKRLELERCKQADRREKARQAGIKSGRARSYAANERSTDVELKPNTSSSSSSSSTDLNTYSLPLEAPESLQSALQAWSKLQKQNFRRNVSQVEVDALIMSWAPRFAELEAAIIYSTANGWKNIREKTQEGSGTNGTHQAVYPKRQTAQEAKAERLKALHAKMTELDEQDRIAGKQVKITMGDIFK